VCNVDILCSLAMRDSEGGKRGKAASAPVFSNFEMYQMFLSSSSALLPSVLRIEIHKKAIQLTNPMKAHHLDNQMQTSAIDQIITIVIFRIE